MTISPLISSHKVPIVDWIDPVTLARDPYSTYRRLREEAPVAWSPAIRKVLISSYAGCSFAERHPEFFSSDVSGAAMVRALGGRPLIRKDDPEHATERRAMNKALRPKQIMEVWAGKFEANARHYLELMTAEGTAAADLNSDYAAPVAAKNLCDMLGMTDVLPVDLARWSADFIAGSGNVLDNQDVWDRCDKSRAQCDAALDNLLPRLRRHPDASITSMLLEGGMSEEQVRSNVKLTISGGVNEPQHMITNMVWLLDRNPRQRTEVFESQELWTRCFDEAVRFFSPIGMVTRETVKEIEVEGVIVPARTQVGMILASANRDDTQFPKPDVFDIHRSSGGNLAFGSGVHQCAGKWAARKAIGEIAVPLLYEKLPHLRQDPEKTESWGGWVFRGLTSFPVIW